MENMINVADLKNPETGLTYREENLKKVHNIPLGALVEIIYNDPDEEQNEHGLRLFVAMHARDCDGTPLYSLTSMTPYTRHLNASVLGEDSVLYRGHFTHGHSEESLKIIRLPGGEFAKPALTKGFIIHGSTGCSCCRDSNFVDGIYDTLEQAMETADNHVKARRVRSQYSNTGIYTIREIEYEEMIDGRIIIGNLVFDDKHSLYTHDNIAERLNYEGKSHGYLGTYVRD